MIAHPESATLMVIFALYANLSVVAIRVHGVPPVVAASFFLLLAIPLFRYVSLEKQGVVTDFPWKLSLVYLVPMSLSALLSRQPAESFPVILNYLAEGVLLYLLIVNTIRTRSLLDPQSFDAVVNGFGMCHLPNPEVALREAFRVLKSGGRVAFTVWDIPERSVGFGAVYVAVRAHGSMDVGLPAGPNFFLFSDPERSAKALLAAGFISPSCRQVPQVWRVADPDKVFQSIAEGSVRAAATIRAQTPAAKEAIRAAMRDTVVTYRRGDSYEVPMPATLATAVKP
jgi:SAM-dependent methyltransferase